MITLYDRATSPRSTASGISSTGNRNDNWQRLAIGVQIHVGRLLVTAWVLVDRWMLVVVAAVDCCCWLLLLVAAAGCCCWLLLLIAAVGCCCWLLLLIAAAGILLAGGKVLEYFQDVDDLRLRQFCRRKSLWIFSPRWWENLAETSFEIVLGYFLSDGLVPEVIWEGSEGGFRLGNVG